jgi:post-segregation antitoxin (ccd killing protein)
MRTTTTIRVDSEVLETAQALGLNVSKACETALKHYICSLTTVNNEINHSAFLNECSFAKENSKPRAGFEPATTALPRRCPTRLGYRGLCYFDNWDKI